MNHPVPSRATINIPGIPDLRHRLGRIVALTRRLSMEFRLFSRIHDVGEESYGQFPRFDSIDPVRTISRNRNIVTTARGTDASPYRRPAATGVEAAKKRTYIHISND